MLIKQIGESLMKTASRRRWSQRQPGRQITVKNSHVNCCKVPGLNINFLRKRARKMKVGKKQKWSEGRVWLMTKDLITDWPAR